MKNNFLALVAFICSFANAQMKPYLQTPTSNSIWVTWQTTSGSESTVQYGTSASNLNNTVSGASDAITGSWIWHKVKLTGLTPDTPYYYRVKTGSTTSSTFRFRTQPVDGHTTGHYRFIILGDHQRNDDRYGDLVNAAKAKAESKWGTPLEDHARLIVNTGDESQEGNLLNHWNRVQFGEGAPLTQNIPCITVVGNHDDGGSFGSDTNVGGGIGYYSRLFTYSDDVNFHYKGMTGNHGDNYYSFQVGNIGFICENSNQVWQDQTDYVNNVTAAMKTDNNIEWVFNNCHHPMYAEQLPGDARQFVIDNYAEAVINTGKAAMIMSGHAHLYARGAMEEASLFHMINGGASWDQLWNETASQIDLPQVQKTICRQVYTLVDIDLDNDSYTAETYSIGLTNGQVNFTEDVLVDSFTFNKNATAPTKPATITVPATISLPYEFQGATYVGAEPYNSTEFQFAGADADFTEPIHAVKRDFENIFYKSGDNNWQITDLNAGVDIFKLNVAADKLYSGTNYVRVRYRDQSMRWSDWSDPVAFSTTNGQLVEPTVNLVAHFPFTGGSILDESNSGVDFDNATNNGATLSNNAQRGDYMEFDNNDIITIQTNSANGLPTTGVTVSTWVRVDAADVWGGFVGAMFEDSGTTEFGWVLGTRNQKFSFALKSKNNSLLTYLTDPTDFNIGQWYHVVGTYDGKRMKLFVDGVEKNNSLAQSGDIDYYPTGYFQIGSYKDSNEDIRHDGGLDDVRVWENALSASEVSDLYNGIPVVNFSSDKTNITVGESIQFNNQSIAENVTGYTWTFEGGNPNVSFVENPSVVYNTAGTYKVSLEVATANGNVTKEMIDYIKVSEPDDPNAKIAYFPLDADILDASTAGKDFDNGVNNTADFAHGAERAQYLQFDGNDMVTIQSGANAADGLPTEDFTIGSWVYVSTSEVWGGFVGCFQDNGTVEEEGWVLGQRSQKFSIALRTSGNSRMTYLEDTDTFTLNNWYYVAATYDGASLKLFVDGVEKASTTAQSGAIVYPTSAATYFQLGSYKDSNEDNRLNGALDDVSIWPRALTEAEIIAEKEGNVVVPPPVEEDDRIAYFPLKTDVLDASTKGKDFDAGINSGVTFVNDAQQGQVAEFDGTDIITLQTGTNAFDGLPTQDFTIGTWVKANSGQVWGGFVGCFQDNGTVTEEGWVLGTRSQKFSIALRTNGNSRLTYLVDTDDFTAGQWYYVAATYDGTTLKLYVDGVEKASTTAQSGAIVYPTLASSQFQIGSYKDSNEDNRLDGSMQDLSIWDRALTSAEINEQVYGNSNAGIIFKPNFDTENQASISPMKIDLTLSPNPVNGNSVQIAIEESILVNRIGVIDVYGNTKMYKIINGSFQSENVDVSSLSTGMYFVNITKLDGTTIVKKLLVE